MTIEFGQNIGRDVEKIETGEKVYNFLSKIGFLEIRKSDEKFNEWIQNLSFEDFLSHLTRLNGIIRENSTKNRSIDGQNVVVSLGAGGVAYLPPYKEQKDKLMKDSFDALKYISNNEDRATLLYYSSNSSIF